MRDSNLKIITECCNILNQSAEPGRVLSQLCKYLCDAVNARVCVICRHDPVEDRLQMAASHGLFVNELRHFQIRVTLSEQVFKRQRLLNTPINKDYTLEGKHIIPSLAVRHGSMLVHPLFVSGRIIGTITLMRKARQAFPKSIVDIVAVLSTTLAAYLSNTPAHWTSLSGANSGEAKNSSSNAPETFLHGKPIVPGMAYGRCLVLAGDDALLTTPLRHTDDIQKQMQLLESTYASARATLEKSRQEIGNFISEADDGIFEMYATLMDDPTLRERIEKNIASGLTVESALAVTYKDFALEFQQIDDEYLRERLQDVEDIALRLLNACRDTSARATAEDAAAGQSDEPLILVARELFTSQLISAPLKQVRGIVCQSDVATSHATILARALRIPMMSGINDIYNTLDSNDFVLLDCQTGFFFRNPSAAILEQYHPSLEMNQHNRETQPVENAPLDDLPTTTDGTQIQLCGNITLSSEMPLLHAAGIREIGLYRTEFMFLIRNSMPDEETQFHVLKHLVDNADGATVIIRTLDIGGDKPLPYLACGTEANPSLGCRGLRFLLAEENRDCALTHFRAILRIAAAAPNVSVMFPMVADLNDLRQAKALFSQAASQLSAAGIRAGNPAIGIMVELPSAAFSLEQLLPETDFISIGTNDLVQYLFGVDRVNSRVSQWYRQCHPAVFRLLGEICRVAEQYPQKRVELCGELAGNPRALPALLGAGLRCLSMNPVNINDIRDYIRHVSKAECVAIFQDVCRCSTSEEVHALLDKFRKAHSI